MAKFPQWKGFEFSPEGCLLEQFIDIDGDMGIAYERSCEFYKDFHTHDRLMLIFPRGSSSMEVRTKNKKIFRVDSSSVLFVPKDLEHDDEGTAAIYDTMALYPSPKLMQAVANKLKLSSQDLSDLATQCLKIKRNPRLETYVQDYFFERVISRRDRLDEDSAYLARRILEETFCLLFPHGRKKTEDKPVQEGSVSERALRVIETNLFEELELDSIAKQAGASVSTLLRRFKEDLDTTPYAYIKHRRMEEALLLLKSKKYAVGEVAALVGYENFGAFSDAFKTKFGKVPSQIVKGRAAQSDA